METIYATEIYISELKFITTGAVYAGYTRVSLKGKVRSDILYELKVLCKDAGVDEQKYFFIITAFICCDLLLNLGHLADLLGHCSVNITRIYTKISLKKQKNVWAT